MNKTERHVTTRQCGALQGRQLWADVIVSSVMLSLLCFLLAGRRKETMRLSLQSSEVLHTHADIYKHMPRMISNVMHFQLGAALAESCA